jgi:hypothetical protein
MQQQSDPGPKAVERREERRPQQGRRQKSRRDNDGPSPDRPSPAQRQAPDDQKKSGEDEAKSTLGSRLNSVLSPKIFVQSGS